MMYQLRDYQQQAVNAAVNFFTSPTKGNAIMVLPTGAGKSLVLANIALSLSAPVLIFQPGREILQQNYEKLLSYGFDEAGIFSASFGRREIKMITFATIRSVKNYKEYFSKFKYVLIDECHLVNPEQGMYKDFFDTIRCKILGVTATPYSLYSSLMGSMLKFITRTCPRIFSHVIYQIQIAELLRRGYLAQLNYYSLNVVEPNLLTLNSTGSDYSEESLRKYYEDIKYNDTLENIVRRLLKAGRGSVLVFTRFVEEAEALAETLGADIARTVSADMKKNDRIRILNNFKSGKIKVVVNVGILTTGFDFPALATVVLARPTMSLALYYQMVGRAIRPYKDKIGWIVDLCGNLRRFGRVDELYLHDTGDGKWAVFSGQKQLTNVFLDRGYGKKER